MSSHSFPPAGFSWLLPAFRPTRREVKAYAEAIRAVDEDRGRKERSPLRQAELQLWVWRMETRQPAPRARRMARSPADEAPGGPTSMVGALPAF